MENQGASARIEALSLADMSSAFVVFGLGASLSVLVFLIEFIYKCAKDYYFTDDIITISVQPTQPVAAIKLKIPTILRVVDRQVKAVQSADNKVKIVTFPEKRN